MRKPATKFKRKFDKGGFFKTGLGSTAGFKSAVTGAGAFLGKPLSPQLDASIADEQYLKDMDSANATGNAISGLGDIASNIPGIGGLVGGLIGGIGGAIGDLFGGSAAKEKAAREARLRKVQRDIAVTSEAGARNMNAIPKYQSPPYGRRGLKIRLKGPSMPGMKSRFTTKFSKPC